MRSFFCVVVLSLIGCAEKPGPQGEQGPVGFTGRTGPQGPAGRVGPAGPQGPAGPAGPPGGALANITVVPAGQACPYGGIEVQAADGGVSFVCNGAPGGAGPQGPAGATGSPGPTGAPGPASSLLMYDSAGNKVGHVFTSSQAQDEFDDVWVESAGCIGYVDYLNNKVSAFDNKVLYTGPNCTGTSWMAKGQGQFFPMSCNAVGTNFFFKAQQPIQVQQYNSQSAYMEFNMQSDGGYTVGCYTWTETGTYGVAVQMMTLPAITGPFTMSL